MVWKQNDYDNRPEVKQRKKEYAKRPEVMARRRERMKAYRKSKALNGEYGYCKICRGILGRNENKKHEICKRCFRGKNTPWFVGTKINNQGYKFIWKPEHPKALKNYIAEHRFVMEQKLERYLFPNENVHHINGVKTDNRPENLELWVKSQPAGQRPEDLVKWAKEILKLY